MAPKKYPRKEKDAVATAPVAPEKFPAMKIEHPRAILPAEEKLLRIARELTKRARALPYYLQARVSQKDIERYSDKYKQQDYGHPSLSEIKTCISYFPEEIQSAPFSEKRVRPVVSQKTHDHRRTDVSKHLAKLSELEGKEESDEEDKDEPKKKQKTNEDDEENEDEDEEEAEDVDEEDGDYAWYYDDERDDVGGGGGDDGDDGEATY